METAEALKRRMDTAETLRDLVRTMKTLAAVSIRRYEASVAALTDYDHTVQLGLRALLWHAPAPPPSRARSTPGRTGALVFGSDQGLCGTFNEQVVDRVRADVASGAVASPRLRVHAVGGRVAARLAEAGLAPEGETTLPLSPSLLAGLVQDLLLLVDGWRADGDLERVLLYVNRPLSTGAAEPHRSTLLPITWEQLGRQPWPTRMLPLHTVDRPVLLAALLHHHLFVRLHQALAFSLATEHAARLMAMQAAERNIDERLEELRSQYHDQRQTAITAELLDIVSGAEALAGAGT